MGKIIHNFRRGPVLGTDELTPNLPIAVDHVALRKAKRSIKRIAMPLGIANGREVNAMIGKKLSIRIPIRVHGDAQHRQLRQLVLQFVERRDLLDTWSAPGSPEIEHHHLAPVGAQLQPATAVI